MYFETLKPADFIDLEVTETQSEEDQEKEGVSKEDMQEDFVKMSDDDLNQVYDDLEGEIIEDDKWELVDERDQGAEESYEDWAKRLIKENKKEEFADVIDDTPDVFSVLDKSYYRIRFKYIKKSRRRTTPSGKPMSNKSRDFCVNMMNRTAKGIVYRIEDIDKASQDGVNKSFGHKGKKYDLFKYKGGVYCLHAWSEVLYRLKEGSTLKDTGNDSLDDYKETKSIPKSYRPKPRGSKEAVQAAKKSNNWWKYPGRK